MNITNWFGQRGPDFILKRAITLLDRYGLTAGKATSRIDHILAKLTQFGCSPTFPTPGSVVKRNSRFLNHLQDAGVEIAVHSFDHIDLKTISISKAIDQLVRGASAFEQHGIKYHGFRCPYLSCSDELLNSLPNDLFEYSSNKAIEWSIIPISEHEKKPKIFNTIQGLYTPRSSDNVICVPWKQSGMIEIPVCIPDDLQLHDGLNLDSEGISLAWIELLHQTYKRGELFNLIFHPELGSVCEPSFEHLLKEAFQLKPVVWITRLNDVSDWWREKATFSVEITPTSTGLQISFICSPDATILVRGLNIYNPEQVWDGTYHWFKSKILEVPPYPRPFVGIAPSVPERIASFLQEQGYILDRSQEAVHCEIYIDTVVLAKLSDEVKLINFIEAYNGPLIRFWRWPNGAKSALCITGDLDALSLLDYTSRLFIPRG